MSSMICSALPVKGRRAVPDTGELGSYTGALNEIVSANGSRPAASASRRSRSSEAFSSAGVNGTAGFAPTGCHPSPRRAARRIAGRLWPPTQIGGCGFCTGNGRHWIKIRLVGVRSTRCAVGARLRLEIDDGAGRRSIYRHVGTGGSFGGNPLRQEIGLADAARIAVLEVLWPATGETQRLEDIAADRMIEVTEGVQDYRTVPLRVFSFASGG